MIVYIMVALMLIYESIVDIKKRYIHIRPVVVTGLLGGILNIALYGHKTDFLLEGAAVGGILLLMAFASRQQIGYGDAVVFISLGICLGPAGALWVLWLSMVGTAVAGLVKLIRKKGGWHSKLPYIPFVTSGYMVLLPFMFMKP